MDYKVIHRHRCEYPVPVSVHTGDRLRVGERYEGPEAWDDWYFCTAPDGVQGWVPGSVFRRLAGDQAEALEDYCSRELDVDDGETLTGLRSRNGWLWCRRPSTGEEGWVPLESLAPTGTDLANARPATGP
ncbi:SH3 domain-containing protein [Phaeovibrio sulfidiphilus]|uniref:SH3 domain-containing protein n=1 Tax=Phaeovibrio sulfidiphilus TaxID=1220600 RepID=A0A8J7CQF8_9PROT|nr:SH3 domain-containing protein [Phaeovibrio sulfidiphilus]MBE1236780.1 SH3 domain-containing protein [Phaeovibrio sulfidiphilus]